METLQFKTTIDAAPEKVWDVLLGKANYPLWTSVFAEGSAVKTTWEKGSKAIFHDGNDMGMVSTIVENIPDKFISIKHLGTVKNGVEDFDSPEAKKWGGSLENYTLKDLSGKTELIIDIDVIEEYKDYFLKTWPAALEKVKEIAEQQ
jgi:uncharacterized protein YndB with AHSA1/START domain